MSLNIKDEHTHALVRELAALTGQSQKGAVEDAVARRLAELRREAGAQGSLSRDATIDLLLERLWSSDWGDLRQAEADLYYESGLPR